MIEHRDITCLECQHMSLQDYPAEAKYGWSTCKAKSDLPARVFMRVQMARNCAQYEEAPAEQVRTRQEWADRNPIPIWQR